MSSNPYIAATFILLASNLTIHSFIHSFTGNTIMECFLISRHLCWKCSSRGEHSKPGLCSHGGYTGARVVTLKPRYDDGIPCSAFFSRFSNFSPLSPFLRGVWNSLRKTLLTASPGEPRLQLDTGPPRMHSFQTLMKPETCSVHY